jgi:nitrite reductase (NO-forming)
MRRVLSVLALAAVAVAGLAVAGVFTSGTATAKPKPKHKIVKVTVVMKEFKFALSRRSVPTGTTVVFKVVNRGKITHDFKIAGKKTKNLNPGKSTTLTVKFAKKGRYAYLCTIPGHAAAGMKGVFAVGVPATKPRPTPTTTTTATTTTPPPTTTTPVGDARTTVTVGMFEYRFDLTQSTVPSGQVTFAIANKGQQVHNFSILGGKVGKLLSPGQSETWTVALPPGSYNYQCDVPFHAGYGMVGSFTVTP